MWTHMYVEEDQFSFIRNIAQKKLRKTYMQTILRIPFWNFRETTSLDKRRRSGHILNEKKKLCHGCNT